MPASTDPNLGLSYGWSFRESNWKTGMDDNLIALGALTQLAVIDRDLATPPISPTAGDRYLVAGSPTGAWTGHATKIALFIASAWRFYTPRRGWMCYVIDENIFIYFSASDVWTAL